MLYQAKNATVPLDNTDMDYVSFGRGREALVMLPGLGDGLSTVRGKAIALAMMYRMYAKRYTVYIFSRKNDLREGTSTRAMARDQAEAMRALGISKANVLGISQGGMIAQYLAIDYPDMVSKLVLAVTLAKQNETIQKAVSAWIAFAKQGDFKALMVDTAERSYSERYITKHRMLLPLLGSLGRPESFTRFLIQANSCIQHDSFDELAKIVCPTLVIGGGCDRIVGATAALELAENINGSELLLYEGLGHALYEEARDFHTRVLAFLGKE